MKLVIGNKNYSSWSMRPWVLLRQFGIPFEEVMVRLDDFVPDSPFKRAMAPLAAAGKVPVLVEDGGFVVWDSLAIAEYLAEKFPAVALWPRDARRRARARSLCAEMHSGFGALRTHFPMNIEASMREVGARVLNERPEVRADIERVCALWEAALAESGGPFLFGEFSIADAYFSPVVARLRSYAPPLPAAAAAYVARVLESEGVAAWTREALAEKVFLPTAEPYRGSRD